MNVIFPSSPRFTERPPPFPSVALHPSSVTPARVSEAASSITTSIPPPLFAKQSFSVVNEIWTEQAADSLRESAPPILAEQLVNAVGQSGVPVITREAVLSVSSA